MVALLVHMSVRGRQFRVRLSAISDNPPAGCFCQARVVAHAQRCPVQHCAFYTFPCGKTDASKKERYFCDRKASETDRFYEKEGSKDCFYVARQEILV